MLVLRIDVAGSSAIVPHRCCMRCYTGHADALGTLWTVCESWEKLTAVAMNKQVAARLAEQRLAEWRRLGYAEWQALLEDHDHREVVGEDGTRYSVCSSAIDDGDGRIRMRVAVDDGGWSASASTPSRRLPTCVPSRAARVTADRSQRMAWLAGAADDAYLAGDGERVRRLAAEVLDATGGITDPRLRKAR
jgi:hypothetical protein